jgi:hypothetical protein
MDINDKSKNSFDGSICARDFLVHGCSNWYFHWQHGGIQLDGLVTVETFCDGLDTPRETRIEVNQRFALLDVSILDSVDFLLFPGRGDLGPFPPSFENFLVEIVRNGEDLQAIGVTFPNGTVFPCTHLIARRDRQAIRLSIEASGETSSLPAEVLAEVEDWLAETAQMCRRPGRIDSEVDRYCASRPSIPGISTDVIQPVRSDIVALRSVGSIFLELPEGQRTVVFYGPNATIIQTGDTQ